MTKKRGICVNCRREMYIHGKKMCCTCFKKLFWKQRTFLCPRCKRKMPYHAKGLCDGCYNYVFYLDKTKERNYKRWYNLNIKTYKQITKSCKICNFNKIIDLHHIDNNHDNNSEENLIGLCPNHHKMIHMFQYKKEIIAQLENVMS